MGSVRRKHHLDKVNGSITIEAAVLIPVLITLCAGLISLGVRLSNYIYLNQIGRELVLQMGGVKCLANFSSASLPPTYTFTVGPTLYDPPEIPSDTVVSSCLSAVETLPCPAIGADIATQCPLNVLYYYAVTLVKSKALRVNGNISLEYSLTPPASNPASGVCLINIRFTAHDITWMNFIGGPISTLTQGPYLSSPMPDANMNCVL